MTMTSSERQRAKAMLDSLDKATQRRILASISSFAEWLSNAAYSIYVKVKDTIYGIWESIVCEIGETINAVGKVAICLSKKVAETEIGKQIAKSEIGQQIARTNLGQTISSLWKSCDNSNYYD